MPSDRQYDLFLSYSHADTEPVRPIARALRAGGLAVWMDESDVADFASISRSIAEGLACSKALVAYYSSTYPLRRPCQWELAAAFLAAQRKGDPRQRVLVINPEPGADHIYPVELRDALFLRAPESAPDLAGNVRRLASHVGDLAGTLGEIEPLAQPPWFGTRGVGSTRFVGRAAELWQVHSALHATDVPVITDARGAPVAQLRGLGGVGKSLLAEEYARRFGAAFPGGVFWLRASGHGDTGATADSAQREIDRQRQIVALAAALGIAVERRKPEEIEGELGATIGRRGLACLWVVDDVPAGLGADELRRWWAPHGSARTLMTTRSRGYGALATAVDLGTLAPDDAFELLTAKRPPRGDGEETAARGIVEDLGRHALAIDVAGAALAVAAGLQSFAEFRSALADPDQDELEFAAELEGVLPSGREKSIATTLLRSIERLDDPGRDFLRLAAVLAGAPIPVNLVQAVLGTADNLDEEVARRRAVAALSQADSLSLCETPEEELRAVHTLISRTVRRHDTRTDRSDELREAAAGVLLHALRSLDPRLLNDELPHARELAHRAGTVEEIGLLGWVGGSDQNRGAYRSAESLYRKQMTGLQTTFGADHPEVFSAMTRVAEARRDQGDYAMAAELHERVLVFRRRELGEEHPDTVAAMNNLGSALFDQGENEDAEELYVSAIGTARRVLGPLHPYTLGSIANLASVYMKTGDYSAARDLEEPVLEIRRSTQGRESSATLTSMNNLAFIRRSQGDAEGARQLYEETLAIRRRQFGDEHPLTLAVRNNVAELMAATGDLASASATQERVLEASRRVLGAENPQTLRAMSNLGSTLREAGEKEAARELLEQVVTTRRELLGADHPDTVLAERKLGELRSARSDSGGAAKAPDSRAAGRHEPIDFQRRKELRADLTRAEERRADGDPEGARELLEPLLESLRRERGPEAPETLGAMNSLALTFKALGRLARARPLLEELVGAARTTLGTENVETAIAMANLGETLFAMDDYAAAREVFEEAHGIRRRLLGAEHASTAEVAGELFLTLDRLEDHAAAQEVLTEHLGWLFRRDPAELDGEQRKTRELLSGLPFMDSRYELAAGPGPDRTPESPESAGSEPEILEGELQAGVQDMLAGMFQSMNLQLAQQGQGPAFPAPGVALQRLDAALEKLGIDTSETSQDGSHEPAGGDRSERATPGEMAMVTAAFIGLTLLAALAAQTLFKALGSPVSYWRTSLGALAGVAAVPVVWAVLFAVYGLWTGLRRREIDTRRTTLAGFVIGTLVSVAVAWWVGGGPSVTTLVITVVAGFALQLLYNARKEPQP